MLNRTNIEEANKHLQALYARVSELERVIDEQHNALGAKDAFIQAKAEKLSQQDIVMQDLKHKLDASDRELSKRNELVNSQEEELKAKDLQLSVLKQKSKALSDLIDLLPDLKCFITKVDVIALKVHELDDSNDNRYIEVNESPSLSDDADNTDCGIIKTYAKPEESSFGNIEGSTSVAEMARNFAKLDGTKTFSVTEEDSEEGSVTLGRNNNTTKELYF